MFKANNIYIDNLCRSGVFLVSFENISHLFPLFLLLILNMYLFAQLDPKGAGQVQLLGMCRG